MINLRTLLILALIFLICSETESASLSRMEKLFLQEKYERAIAEADELIDSRAPGRDELYYLRGLSQLKMGRFSEARESFNTVISRYQKSKRLLDAHIGIGDSYLLGGDARTAKRIYDEALKKFPNDNNRSLLTGRIAMCEDTRGVKPAASSTQTGPSNFSVQAGCFKSKSNASKLARKLSDQGYDSYIVTPPGSELYHVRVGKLRSKKETESLESRLKRKGYTTRVCQDDACR